MNQPCLYQKPQSLSATPIATATVLGLEYLFFLCPLTLPTLLLNDALLNSLGLLHRSRPPNSYQDADFINLTVNDQGSSLGDGQSVKALTKRRNLERLTTLNEDVNINKFQCWMRENFQYSGPSK